MGDRAVTNLNATAVALCGISALLILGVLRWEDVLANAVLGMPWSGSVGSCR